MPWAAPAVSRMLLPGCQIGVVSANHCIAITGIVAIDGELASEHLGIADVLAITFGHDLSLPPHSFLRDQPHVRRHAEGCRCSPGYRSEA